MYHYLTGAASWYMMTMITQVFGVKGDMGDLTAAPKLLAEQFDESGLAGMNFTFAGKKFSMTVRNSEKKEYGDYMILSAFLDQKALDVSSEAVRISRADIMKFDDREHELQLVLG